MSHTMLRGPTINQIRDPFFDFFKLAEVEVENENICLTSGFQTDHISANLDTYLINFNKTQRQRDVAFSIENEVSFGSIA